MTVHEFYLLHETKRPRGDDDYAGRLTEKDCRDLYERLA